MEPIPDDEEASPETQRVLRRASMSFSQSQPYTRIQRKGSIFPPVEAGGGDSDQDAGDEEVLSMPNEAAGRDGAKEGARDKDEGSATFHSGSTFTYGTSGKGRNEALVLHVQVFADDFNSPKHCLANGRLKPRRPVPHIRASELIKGLELVNGEWIFKGALNEWPAYTHYCLRSLTSLTDYRVMKKVNRIWRAEDGRPLPRAEELPKETRATFVAPTWTEFGWAPDSPGYVFWYSACHGSARVLFGEGMIGTLEADEITGEAVRVSAFAHRYPSAKESFEDKNTYHIGCFIEWSHGQFGTIAELAWRHGVGGYGGRANWIPDKLEPETELFKAMADGMKQPWSSKHTEIRMYDIHCTTKEEFEAYLHAHSEKKQPLAQQRFLEPRVYASAPVRLRRCTAPMLAEHILNYIARVPGYNKLTANCQTFGADLYAFLTGSKGVEPFHQVCKVGYKQRTLSFLYQPRYGDVDAEE